MFFAILRVLILCVSGVCHAVDTYPVNYQLLAYVIVLYMNEMMYFNEMPTTPQQNKILGIPTSKQITKLYNILTNRETIPINYFYRN